VLQRLRPCSPDCRGARPLLGGVGRLRRWCARPLQALPSWS